MISYKNPDTEHVGANHLWLRYDLKIYFILLIKSQITITQQK